MRNVFSVATYTSMLLVIVLFVSACDLLDNNHNPHEMRDNINRARVEVRRLSMAVDEYYLDNGTLPRSLEELLRKPSNTRNWNGPYIKESNLHDPWNNAYQYRYPGEHRAFDIWSYGADGSPGGGGNDADITNWD